MNIKLSELSRYFSNPSLDAPLLKMRKAEFRNRIQKPLDFSMKYILILFYSVQFELV